MYLLCICCLFVCVCSLFGWWVLFFSGFFFLLISFICGRFVECFWIHSAGWLIAGLDLLQLLGFVCLNDFFCIYLLIWIYLICCFYLGWLIGYLVDMHILARALEPFTYGMGRICSHKRGYFLPGPACLKNKLPLFCGAPKLVIVHNTYIF